MRQFRNVVVKPVQNDARRVRRCDGDRLSPLKNDARVSHVVVFQVDDDLRRWVDTAVLFVHLRVYDLVSGQLLIAGAPVSFEGVLVRVPDSKFGIVGDADDRHEDRIYSEASDLEE